MLFPFSYHCFSPRIKEPGIGNVGPAETTLFPPNLLDVLAIPYGAMPCGIVFFNGAFFSSSFYSSI